MNLRQAPYSLTSLVSNFLASGQPRDHIVDQLIAERATAMSRHPAWPVLRPLIYRYFDYDLAVAMADEIAPLSGLEAFDFLSRLLALDVSVTGRQNIPRTGGFVLAPSHPTGIADGIAVYELMKSVRTDLSIFANRDALRVAVGFRDMIIPVEWRQGEKTRSKSRDTLEMTARAFSGERAVVLFPSGRIAYWNGGKLTERPWQPSFVALARRYNVPVVPVRITARNSGLFYFLSKYSTEMRDMTIFHELLNKKCKPFSITVGKPVAPDLLAGDAAQVAALLQAHTVEGLAADPDAEFVRD
ncbi:acyltransferase [Aliihoeflea aestuarii]|uniref:1-acyl-sn-glycerol-3-phosphate acyltransferase n=1 Tax=Aliihoeflea aestuarii TaxID=453840 RepID=UPI00209522A9|nr:1-acyl-sn-glycerol-3-phosphate acyltransferase [Aliihoeflea aestuarii]MCO6393298.1 acyltransferase [Aliihoeflea aestuarii]